MRREFLIRISGIPWVFGSAPTYTPAAGYTYVPCILPGTIEESADEWDLRGGTPSPGSLTFSMVDDTLAGTYPDGFLSYLFAFGRSTILSTHLMQELAWGIIGNPISVVDTTLFPAAGILYLGLETMVYTGKAAALFTGVTRAQYNTIGLYHPIEGITDPEYYGNPQFTDWPTVWRGRFVTMQTYEVNERGEATTGTTDRWRGYLDDFTYNDDGTIQISASSLLMAVADNLVGDSVRKAWLKTTADDVAPGVYSAGFWYFDKEFLINAYSVGVATYTWVVGPGIYYSPYDLWDSAGLMTAGIPVTMTGTLSDDGAVIMKFEAGGQSVQITADSDILEALGFDSGGQFFLDANATLEASRPLAKAFYSPGTTVLFVDEPAPFTRNVYGSGGYILPCVAVKCSTSSGEWVNFWRLVALNDYDGDGTADGLNVKQTTTPGQTKFTPRATWTDTTEGLEVSSAMLVNDVDAAEFCASVLVSCGGDGYNSVYDVFPDYGLCIPENYVNWNSFYRQSGGQHKRTFAVIDGIPASDLIAPDCQLLQRRLAMWQGLIYYVQIGPAPESGGRDVVVEEADCHSPAVLELDTAMALNRLTVEANYRIDDDSYQMEESVFESKEAKGRGASGVCNASITHRGLRVRNDAAIEKISTLAGDAFQVFGLGVHKITFDMALDDALLIRPVDHVLLTHSKVRNPLTGTKGVTNLRCPVWKIEHHWADASATVTLLVFPTVPRISGYAPAGQIVSYDSGTGALTLDANEYSPIWHGADASFFEAGDVVIITRASVYAESTTINTTVVSVVGNVVTVAAGLAFPGPIAIAAGDRIRYDTWLSTTVSQQEYVALADFTTGLIGGTDPPWKFGKGGS